MKVIYHNPDHFGEFYPAKSSKARRRMKRVGGPTEGSERWKEIQQQKRERDEGYPPEELRCEVIPDRPPVPRVVLARRYRGLSRGDVADLTGVGAARLREIDRGSFPTIGELDLLVCHLGFPHSFFRRPPLPMLGPAFLCHTSP